MAYKDKETARLAMQLYRETNREACSAYQKAYDASHRQEKRERCKKYRKNHPEKHRGYERKRNAKNPEKHRAAVKVWMAAHPDQVRIRQARISERYRARKAGSERVDLTADQWQTIKEAFDFRCAYCGKKPKRLEKDHITPISKQGSHTLWNIVPSCRSCNAKKHAGPAPIPVQPLLL